MTYAQEENIDYSYTSRDSFGGSGLFCIYEPREKTEVSEGRREGSV